jgi:hypothetical protein
MLSYSSRRRDLSSLIGGVAGGFPIAYEAAIPAIAFVAS